VGFNLILHSGERVRQWIVGDGGHDGKKQLRQNDEQLF
jgi:hypothetical protein